MSIADEDLELLARVSRALRSDRGEAYGILRARHDVIMAFRILHALDGPAPPPPKPAPTTAPLSREERERLRQERDKTVRARLRIAAAITPVLTKERVRRRRTKELGSLTPAEILVLLAASDGLGIKETATWLNKSPETVKSRRKGIIASLNARNMAHAVARAFQAGLLE